MSKKDEPQAKGGRRRQKPDAAKHPVSPNSLKNLRPWKSGESGNPIGKAKSLVEVTQLARAKTPDMVERLYSIAMNEFGDVPYRDQITAAVAISDRGCGRPAVGIFHGSASPLEQTEDDAPMSALLRAARANPDERMLAKVLAEAERIKAKLAQKQQEQEAHLAEAAEALSRGEEIDGLTALLLRAKAENDAPPPKPKAPPRLEARADFIADSSGHIVAAPAAALPAPDAPKAAAGSKLPPETAAAWTAPEPATAPAAPAPKDAAKPHPGANIPGFQEFLSEKATSAADAERAKKVEAARARGQCQIPPSEAFPPDPREGPEIVNFTRIPGGRGIRRVG